MELPKLDVVPAQIDKLKEHDVSGNVSVGKSILENGVNSNMADVETGLKNRKPDIQENTTFEKGYKYDEKHTDDIKHLPEEVNHKVDVIHKSDKDRPKSKLNEIEDEHGIRMASPAENRVQISSIPTQSEEKFDVNDLSFFDTPAHTQTDMVVPSIKVTDNDDTKFKDLNKIDSPDSVKSPVKQTATLKDDGYDNKNDTVNEYGQRVETLSGQLELCRDKLTNGEDAKPHGDRETSTHLVRETVNDAIQPILDKYDDKENTNVNEQTDLPEKDKGGARDSSPVQPREMVQEKIMNVGQTAKETSNVKRFTIDSREDTSKTDEIPDILTPDLNSHAQTASLSKKDTSKENNMRQLMSENIDRHLEDVSKISPNTSQDIADTDRLHPLTSGSTDIESKNRQTVGKQFDILIFDKMETGEDGNISQNKQNDVVGLKTKDTTLPFSSREGTDGGTKANSSKIDNHASNNLDIERALALESKSGKDSKLSYSTVKYEDDFETEESVQEIEILQSSSANHASTSKSNELHQAAKREEKSPEQNKEKSMLVEDVSDIDMFSREKSKSTIPRIAKNNNKDEKRDDQNDRGHDNRNRAHSLTFSPTKQQTHVDVRSSSKELWDSDNRPTQKDRNANSPSKSRTSNHSRDVNPYFTGRLPSLGIEDDRSNVSKSENRKTPGDTYEEHELQLPDIKSGDKTEPEPVSEHRSTSRILELIQEINAPAQKYQMTKERPLTPKTPSDKRALNQSDQTFLTSTGFSKSPDDDNAIEKNDKTFDLEDTNMTMRDVDLVTSSMMNKYARNEAPASAKFDELPHMKEISQYNKDHRLAETPRIRDNNDNKQSNENGKLPTLHSQSPVKQVYDREKSQHTEIQTLESTTVIANHYKKSSQSGVDATVHPNKRSSSENELKTVIASAKQAYGRDTTTSSSSLLPPLSREVTLESNKAETKQEQDETLSSVRTSRVTDESSHVLICSNCLHQDSNIESAGFCKECQQYLCGNCIDLHKKASDTKRHEIMVAYCVNELAVKQYVKATGYCVDCQHFLCMKCVIRHTGYRANRHHRIIQSSFLSKPTKKPIRTAKTGVHVSFDQNTISSKDDKSEKDSQRIQNRKKILKDIHKGNPYRTNFVNMSQSLYPGPNKKLAVSYADNPKWPQASVSKLPYLVKPKSLQERLFNTPYVSYQKSALYTDTKTAFDPRQMKLKMLQDRYESKTGRNRRTGRRKEEGLFTARREKISDGASLPDIHSKPANPPTKKTEPKRPRPPGLKKVKLLKEYCVSIPFPSGERQTDILAMTCLPNGNILIADQQNNNAKLYSKQFKFKALVQFSNRLADICASNLCPVDVYVATQKHVFEITTMKKGLEVQRKIKVDIKRIEGLTCWKYGIAVVYKKSSLTWEVKLMDYRGNSKSKLEIVNPFTQEIDDGPICYVTTVKGGKRVILTDTKNACMICTDVTSRCVLYETTLPENCTPSFVTSDNQHNVFVSCVDKIQQISKDGNCLGALMTKPDEVKSFGCILYNRSFDLLYVQTARDSIRVYQVF